MDLEPPKVHSLEISEFGYSPDKGIVIKQIRVLDKDGNCIRIADLEKVFLYLHKYPIKFKG
jgi:hypothetical protein